MLMARPLRFLGMARAASRLIFAPCTKKERISIQTGAGLKACVLTGRNETEYEFEITMGEAIVGAELPIKLAAGEVLGVPVSMGQSALRFIRFGFLPNTGRPRLARFRVVLNSRRA